MNLLLNFDPPINFETYRQVYSALSEKFPNLLWQSGVKLLDKKPDFYKNQAYQLFLTGIDLEHPNMVVSFELEAFPDNFFKPDMILNGWEFINSFNSHDALDALNEAGIQLTLDSGDSPVVGNMPKEFILCFNPHLNVKDWPQIANALLTYNSSMLWSNKKSVDKYNPIEEEPDGSTISSLLYSSWLGDSEIVLSWMGDEESCLETQERMFEYEKRTFPILNGWQFVEDHTIDYDITSKLFFENESEELSVVLNPGDKLRCIKTHNMEGHRGYSFDEGKDYVIDEIHYEVGENGEDMLDIINNFGEPRSYTIQKDGMDLNYAYFFEKQPEFDYDETSELFNNINESQENIFIKHSDLHVGMTITVDGTDCEDGKTFDNAIGRVIEYSEYDDDGRYANSYLVLFDNWNKGHNGSGSLEYESICTPNKCWWLYDTDEGCNDDCDSLKMYHVDTHRLFDSLNENKNYDSGFKLLFDPPVEHWKERQHMMDMLEKFNPQSKWCGQNIELSEFTPWKGVYQMFYDNSGKYNPNPCWTWSDQYVRNDGTYLNGWEFLKDVESSNDIYDKTSDLFNSLNEAETDNKVTMIHRDINLTWEDIVKVLLSSYPNLVWQGGGTLMSSKRPLSKTFVINKDRHTNRYLLTHGGRNPEFYFELYPNHEIINMSELTTDIDTTSNLFDSLNESKQQPDSLNILTLTFDPPIYGKDLMPYMEKIETMYPNVRWSSGKMPTDGRILDNTPIGTLFIGHRLVGPNLIVYTSRLMSTPKHASFNYPFTIDGRQWLDFNTNDVFNSLNEASEKRRGRPKKKSGDIDWHRTAIVFDEETKVTDAMGIVKFLQNIGFDKTDFCSPWEGHHFEDFMEYVGNINTRGNIPYFAVDAADDCIIMGEDYYEDGFSERGIISYKDIIATTYFDFFDTINESDESLKWAEDMFNKVKSDSYWVVTDNGRYYPSNMELWSYLKIPGVEKCEDGGLFWQNKCIDKLYENGTLVSPSNGDLCIKGNEEWTDGEYGWARNNSPIYHMIRVKDGGHFAIGSVGVRPYADSAWNISESENETPMNWSYKELEQRPRVGDYFLYAPEDGSTSSNISPNKLYPILRIGRPMWHHEDCYMIEKDDGHIAWFSLTHYNEWFTLVRREDVDSHKLFDSL